MMRQFVQGMLFMLFMGQVFYLAYGVIPGEPSMHSEASYREARK